jgi:hypothetical protein
LRLKSPSSPWPTASCSRMPGQPGPSATSITPAGAGSARRLTSAMRSASRATPCQWPRPAARQPDAPAAARRCRFAPAVLFDDHRDVEPRHRALSVTALPSGRRIATSWIDAAMVAVTCTTRGSSARSEGVDLAQRVDLGGEGRVRRWDRRRCRAAVGARGGIGQRAAAVADRQPRGVARRGRGLFGDLGRMGIARHLAGHGAQPEAFGRVVACRAQAPVVEDQRLGPAPFEEQLAIVGPRDSATHKGLQPRPRRCGSRRGGRSVIGRSFLAGSRRSLVCALRSRALRKRLFDAKRRSCAAGYMM